MSGLIIGTKIRSHNGVTIGETWKTLEIIGSLGTGAELQVLWMNSHVAVMASDVSAGNYAIESIKETMVKIKDSEGNPIEDEPAVHHKFKRIKIIAMSGKYLKTQGGFFSLPIQDWLGRKDFVGFEFEDGTIAGGSPLMYADETGGIWGCWREDRTPVHAMWVLVIPEDESPQKIGSGFINDTENQISNEN